VNRRYRSAALLALTATLLFATVASAQKQQTLPPNLPKIVQQAIDTNNKDCEAGEQPVYRPGFLTIRDINADGSRITS
jgi:hypothetical protein